MADLKDPVPNAIAVTASDSADIPGIEGTTALFVSVTGTLTVTMMGGQVVSFPAITGGMWHPMRVKRVWSTGTSATGIVAGWQ